MAFFNPLKTKEPVTYYEVIKDHITAEYSFHGGHILFVHGAIPPELKAVEAIGHVGKLPTVDPSVLRWLRIGRVFQEVTSATFRARPEPAPLVYLDEPAVLRRKNWTKADLAFAQRELKFPKGTPVVRMTNEGEKIVGFKWPESAIDAFDRASQVKRDLLNA